MRILTRTSFVSRTTQQTIACAVGSALLIGGLGLGALPASATPLPPSQPTSTNAAPVPIRPLAALTPTVYAQLVTNKAQLLPVTPAVFVAKTTVPVVTAVPATEHQVTTLLAQKASATPTRVMNVQLPSVVPSQRVTVPPTVTASATTAATPTLAAPAVQPAPMVPVVSKVSAPAVISSRQASNVVPPKVAIPENVTDIMKVWPSVPSDLAPIMTVLPALPSNVTPIMGVTPGK